MESRGKDGAFRSAEDLALRVPELNRKELTLLARIGALNWVEGVEHRRDALWQVERAGKMEGPLLRQALGEEFAVQAEDFKAQPLVMMSTEERLVADYAGTGLTVGRHPMHYLREELSGRRCVVGGGVAGETRWRVGEGCGVRDCSAAAGDGDGVHLHLDGG